MYNAPAMTEKERENDDEMLIEEEDSLSETDIDLEEIEGREGAKVAKIAKKLKVAESEKGKLHDEVQRLKADFLNSKRRLLEQQKTEVMRTTHTIITELLPLADSFDLAMKDTASWEACDENWRAGILGIQSQLMSIFKRHGVVKIGQAGDAFDPELHEAVGTEDRDNTESGIILEVLQSGYTLKDALLRPARVIISN